MPSAHRLELLEPLRTGNRRLTLSAGVGTDDERKGSIVSALGRWQPSTGDGADQPGGLAVYSAANAAVVDATLNGDFETNSTGWTNNVAGGVITRITTEAKFGAACLQTVNDGVSAAQGPTTAALTGLTAGNKYTASVFIKSVSGAVTVRLGIDWYTALDVVITSTTADITITSAWQRYVLTGTAPALGVHAKVYVINTATTAATYNIDGVQFDNGTVALPFDPANTRVAGRIQLSAAGLLTPTQGWWVTAFTPNWDSANHPGSFPRLLSYGDDLTHWINIFFNPNNTIGQARVGGGAGAASTSAYTPVLGTRALIGGQWTATNVYSIVNATLSAGTGNTDIPTLAATLIDIGTGGTIVTDPQDGPDQWVLLGKGTLVAADVALMDTWRAAATVPPLDQIRRLSPASKSTCLVPARTTDAILLPGFFSGGA